MSLINLILNFPLLSIMHNIIKMLIKYKKSFTITVVKILTTDTLGIKNIIKTGTAEIKSILDIL
jgi:hypothetical protein